MNSVVLVLFVIGTCYCEDFSDRPRNFSIELLHHTQLQTGGHVVISPFGIWSLMSGLAIGATGNSYDELSRVFLLPKDKDSLIKGYKDLKKIVLNPTKSGVSLISANYVFLDKNFTVYPEFKNAIQKDFDATIYVLDFSDPDAARIANGCIDQFEKKTFPNILHADNFRESKMILTNVISFKGLWSLPFNTSNTIVEPFYNHKREIVGSVNMMYQKGEFPFSNVRSLKAFVLELPYSNYEQYSMLFILPYANVPISEMYMHFATVTFKDIFRKLQEDVDTFGLEEIDVRIPRFHINTNVVLNKPLYDMGVSDIFQPNLACFGNMTKENIFVSTIIHAADIEVTEAGTTASAATSATFSDRITAPSFYAKTPFVYFVMEKSTTTVLFAGIYSKPTEY